ncbi:hypothetical protein [Thalassotalea hakodatensis]|uniref:hypothetical protein n=1 Tax=Thalassotalea hakodatensis TaxID=3030492 RepID=UPI002573D5C0|nr:hypothetical protein [Thalassotalea hakodatensis]
MELVNLNETKRNLNMRELNVNETENVNGGVFINPLTIALGIRVAKIAAPHLKRAGIAIGSAIAAAAGFEHGNS